MSEITIGLLLHPGVKEKLLEVVRTSLDRLGDAPAREQATPDDPDLAAWWTDSLRERFQDDAGRLLECLENPDFGRAPFRLTETAAEDLIRATAGVRWVLRTTLFAEVSDEALEAAAFPPVEPDSPAHAGLLCYLFLGGFQEHLIQSLGEG